jgi:branched-chain amino acid transport system substrate-binding protein
MAITDRRSVLLSVGTALALAATPALAQNAPRGEPIKLGLIDIYSGGFAFIADSIRTGYQIAVDEANAAGGLNGRPFQLVTADMGAQVEKAVTEGRRMMLEEKIRYVTVGIHSGAAVAVGNLGREHKSLVIGGFATTKRLTGESGHPYVARANLSTVEIGAVIAEYLKGRPDIKRIATIAPDYEYGQHFIQDFIAAVKVARPDITIVRQEWSKLGATDFSAHVTALQARPVDMIVNGGFGADLINFLKAARDFGLFAGGKVEFFTHGLDLVKMSSVKDSLPARTAGTVWYPFYALDSAQSKAFRGNRKAHENLSHGSDHGWLRGGQDGDRSHPQGGQRRRCRQGGAGHVHRQLRGTHRQDHHPGVRQHGALQLLCGHREA